MSVRIIAGSYKGRRLGSGDKRVRATQDRVREAVFSMIGPKVQEADVLDLYAGTGAYGFECLSRGASRATLVDQSIRLAKENGTVLGIDPDHVIYINRKVKPFLTGCDQRYDLIFLDPPWHLGLTQPTLNAIFQFDILKPSGMIICEHHRDCELDFPGPVQWSVHAYGDTRIALCR